MPRHGLADIGEAVALADDPAFQAWPEEYRRYIFAGGIAAGRRWIAAMIGGQHHQITRLQGRFQFGQAAVAETRGISPPPLMNA